jgi:propionaldehyde dehydrogenase
MRHPGTRLVVVTGGPGVVKAAQASGKRAVCAGPGNPPVVVDDTADPAHAAQSLILGAGVDNNIVCIVEKEAFVHERIADTFISELERQGAYRCRGTEADRVVRTLLADDDHMKKEHVGKNAAVILKSAGINVTGDPPIAFMEVDSVDHPLMRIEQLLPVIPVMRVRDTETAIDLAVKTERGCRHTAVMHSKNIDLLHKMAVAADCSIFVKNGPSYNGIGMEGEGYTAWTIAGPTGEGMTNARTFVRMRRCTLKDHFRIV